MYHDPAGYGILELPAWTVVGRDDIALAADDADPFIRAVRPMAVRRWRDHGETGPAGELRATVDRGAATPTVRAAIGRPRVVFRRPTPTRGMDDSSDRDPMRRGPSRFEDAEQAVHRVDEPPSGSPPGTPTANADESPLRTVGAAVALGVGGILVLGLVTGVIGLAGGAVGLSFEVLSLVSIAVGQYVGFIGLGAAYLRARGFGWRRLRSYLGVRLPTLREVGIIAAGYATIIGTLLVVVSVALRFLPEPAENGGAETFASNPELVPAGIVVMFLVVGPAEEFLFRGVVQNRLRERLSAVPAIAAAAVIFASLHVIALAGSPDAIAVTVGLLLVPGIVLGAVYEYTGNLVVPWLLHSTHNSVLLTILLLGSMAGENVGFLSALV